METQTIPPTTPVFVEQNFQHIQCHLSLGVGQLSLNRPQTHNAFDDIMIAEIITALELFARQADCQVLVLNAQGKHFSAGADLAWMRRQAQMDFEHNLDDAKSLATLMHRLDQFPKPSIALVQGAAYGGALGLICCCDIAIATPDASFCLSEVKLGLIPAVISPYVMRAMGQRQARRYMLTAERFDADTAIKLNVIHQISPTLDESALPLINQLMANSPQAMAWVKRLVRHIEDGTINQDTLDYTSERIARIRVSDEGQEGLNAFFEKRPPNWHATRVNDTGAN
ncbi:enoyl-CoA hydratase-related protein [Shewanella sp. NIFS-20-20]|uniref:enoyl-CoA hydratase-related protein n=1 Tax=Shewanella sp. NIFS-20-20 TaxID=2853806 RepID=UPI001C486AF9|nr:enoyl-CoA hydratase-related protein [Shewanella sp. NIFS-20-20]MBV7317279.1 enoyl-CoA hydratase/isomerase family protein [Shewanella sp. NIFS-20-20]